MKSHIFYHQRCWCLATFTLTFTCYLPYLLQEPLNTNDVTFNCVTRTCQQPPAITSFVSACKHYNEVAARISFCIFDVCTCSLLLNLKSSVSLGWVDVGEWWKLQFWERSCSSVCSCGIDGSASLPRWQRDKQITSWKGWVLARVAGLLVKLARTRCPNYPG